MAHEKVLDSPEDAHVASAAAAIVTPDSSAADSHKRKLDDFELSNMAEPVIESENSANPETLNNGTKEKEEDGGADESESKRPRLECNGDNVTEAEPEPVDDALVSSNGHKEEGKDEPEEDKPEQLEPIVANLEPVENQEPPKEPIELELPQAPLEIVTQELASNENEKTEVGNYDKLGQPNAEFEEPSELPREGDVPVHSAERRSGSDRQILSRKMEVPNDKWFWVITAVMAGKRKRKNVGQRPVIHPRNKFADNSPDFDLLGSLYPSFGQYVFYSHDGRPKIDWTDFNATRELTRVLLLHDHGLSWWIPDGQLCPTVPNRSNYIHWIEDLLASDIIPVNRNDGDVIKGFDIGTGANCIYPLLGASILGWKFVGSDITDVAIEWANRNVKSNPHIANLIEIRRVAYEEELQSDGNFISGDKFDSGTENARDFGNLAASEPHSGLRSHNGPPLLLGVVKDGEIFDFCMCNPPFFETMEEACLNPKTSCGGTPEEMVCFGGERAFITRIIEDSVKLKHTFRWYTSMVGRKYNLSILVSQLWNVGATFVKSTEFVQGRTSRWGLAWSFLPVSRKTTPSNNKIERNNLSFMLEGVQRQHSAFHVLQSLESHLASGGVSCKLDSASFSVDVTATKEQIDAILKRDTLNNGESAVDQHETNGSNWPSDCQCKPDAIRFRISVFQQNPGSLLVRGTLHEKTSSIPGVFLSIFQHLEDVMTRTFHTGKKYRLTCQAPAASLRR